MIVVDASAALALAMPKQLSPAALMFFQSNAALIAPAVFVFETRNTLLKAVRRRQISREDFDGFAADFDALIECRRWDVDGASVTRLTTLAHTTGLSFYDAAYVDLAILEKADLASRDTAMLEAAAKLGVTVHDLS